MDANFTPRHIPLPGLLVELLRTGRWRQPPDSVVFAAVPCLREPVDFLRSESAMRFESQGQCVDLPPFRMYRGSASGLRELPWLDAELSLFIAVNREIGMDVGIALDFRQSISDPRVVASDWSDADGTCYWRAVADSFAEFAGRLGL